MKSSSSSHSIHQSNGKWPDKLRSPLLDASDDDTQNEKDSRELPLLPPWAHCLCGFPIGLLVTIIVHAIAVSLVLIYNTRVVPPSILLGHETFSVVVYICSGLALVVNAYYIYMALVVQQEQPAAAVATSTETTIGIMIGFCSSWTLLSISLFHTIAILPLLLTTMYAFAYFILWERQHANRERANDANSVLCSVV